jgi:HTH-type transcriptional regulator / antitoxin HipB
MSYPIRLTEQLKPQLRALRKARGLTQSQLGELIGIKQARMAEIEAHPGTVSLEQLVKLLSVLGASLHLHVEPAPGTAVPGDQADW